MDSLYKVFVYGTLKQGGHYHDFLKYARLLVSDALTAEASFKMEQFKFDADGGALSPGVKGNGTARVIGEVYEVDESLLQKLDDLEEVGILFERIQVRIAGFGDALMYQLIHDETPFVADENYVHYLEDKNSYCWTCLD